MQTLHNKLISSLQAINQKGDLTDIINILNKRKIHNYAEGAIFMFLLFHDFHNYPDLYDSLSQALQELCQDCYRHVTPNQLFTLLNKPENYEAKQLFDQFIQETVKQEQKPYKSVKKAL